MAEDFSVEQLPALLDAQGIGFQRIAEVNWKDYPYCPEVQFRIAHARTMILLHYRVKEKSVRAVATADNGRVWEDSCVEFFIRLSDKGDEYYNFECNCAGKLLVEYGIPGKREHVSLQVTKDVKRWSSLGTEPFAERVGDCSWNLALIIPVSAFVHHRITDLSDMTFSGNFYKCGDLLDQPHFLSWSPINLSKPCFHCPQFFGKIYFEV